MKRTTSSLFTSVADVKTHSQSSSESGGEAGGERRGGESGEEGGGGRRGGESGEEGGGGRTEEKVMEEEATLKKPVADEVGVHMTHLL